jgi:curved DNA-binding protein CbpA
MEQESSFIDYYEVLHVWPTADTGAIKKAYFKLAKLHHPDIAGGGNVAAEGEDAAVDFKLINEAFATLNDPVKRRAFDEQLKQRTGTVSERKESDRRSAQLAFEQARTSMKNNRYDKAVVLLKSAVKYDDANPAYHSWYGFCLGVLKTHLHQARDACKKALEMEFYNADYHANLGFVYYQAGLTSTADECFEEALKWDPEHHIATRYYKKNSNGEGGDNGGGGIGGFLGRFKRSKGRK